MCETEAATNCVTTRHVVPSAVVPKASYWLKMARRVTVRHLLPQATHSMLNCTFSSDVDECALESHCSHECINTYGSFECICPQGFKVDHDHLTCIDIDECQANITCQHTCYNTPGSYFCECLPGFTEISFIQCAGDDHTVTFQYKLTLTYIATPF